MNFIFRIILFSVQLFLSINLYSQQDILPQIIYDELILRKITEISKFDISEYNQEVLIEKYKYDSLNKVINAFYLSYKSTNSTFIFDTINTILLHKIIYLNNINQIDSVVEKSDNDYKICSKYFYNKINKLSSIVSFKIENKTVKIIKKEIYIYDKKNKIIMNLEVPLFNINNSYNADFIYKFFKYKNKGKKVIEYYSLGNEINEPMIIEYKFDKKNKMLSENYNKNWYLFDFKRYYYNKNGFLFKTIEKDEMGSSITKYTYDTFGLLIKEELINEKQPIQSFIYKYEK